MAQQRTYDKQEVMAIIDQMTRDLQFEDRNNLLDASEDTDENLAQL